MIRDLRCIRLGRSRRGPAEALVTLQGDDRHLAWRGLDRRACHAFAVGAKVEAIHGDRWRALELAQKVWEAEFGTFGSHIEAAEWAGSASPWGSDGRSRRRSVLQADAASHHPPPLYAHLSR